MPAGALVLFRLAINGRRLHPAVLAGMNRDVSVPMAQHSTLPTKLSVNLRRYLDVLHIRTLPTFDGRLNQRPPLDVSPARPMVVKPSPQR